MGWLREQQKWVLAGFSALLLAGSASFTAAHGLTRVQQADGSVRVYRDVRMNLRGETLWIVSSDHQGALEIVDGACSFLGEIQRCFPAAVTLHQHGSSRPITLDSGTVYLNLTGTTARLHHSSRLLAAQTVLAAFHTIHGTFVTVEGHLDSVTR
jgi:drug/metabolite transporter superfamily protein YnfA